MSAPCASCFSVSWFSLSFCLYFLLPLRLFTCFTVLRIFWSSFILYSNLQFLSFFLSFFLYDFSFFLSELKPSERRHVSLVTSVIPLFKSFFTFKHTKFALPLTSFLSSRNCCFLYAICSFCLLYLTTNPFILLVYFVFVCSFAYSHVLYCCTLHII